MDDLLAMEQVNIHRQNTYIQIDIDKLKDTQIEREIDGDFGIRAF